MQLHRMGKIGTILVLFYFLQSVDLRVNRLIVSRVTSQAMYYQSKIGQVVLFATLKGFSNDFK